MTLIGMESLVREIEAEFRHEEAKITFQAIDANGAHVSVTGSSIIFSPRVVMILPDGVPDVLPDLQPTDGSFAWKVRASVQSGVYWKEWVKGVPVRPVGVVEPFGALPNLDRATLQPTEDVVAAWDTVRAETLQARDDTQGLRDETQTLRDEAWEAVDTPGRQGPSAFEVAQANGFTGTEVQWLASLEGDAGLSAYQVAVANGFVGSQAAWLASLKGADGASPTTQAYRDALTPLVGAANGVGSLGASGRQPDGEVNANLTRAALRAAYVTVRTSDGQTLPPGTVVVISIDKTFAQVTANPVADIADITFETGA